MHLPSMLGSLHSSQYSAFKTGIKNLISLNGSSTHICTKCSVIGNNTKNKKNKNKKMFTKYPLVTRSDIAITSQ